MFFTLFPQLLPIPVNRSKGPDGSTDNVIVYAEEIFKKKNPINMAIISVSILKNIVKLICCDKNHKLNSKNKTIHNRIEASCLSVVNPISCDPSAIWHRAIVGGPNAIVGNTKLKKTIYIKCSHLINWKCSVVRLLCIFYYI